VILKNFKNFEKITEKEQKFVGITKIFYQSVYPENLTGLE